MRTATGSQCRNLNSGDVYFLMGCTAFREKGSNLSDAVEGKPAYLRDGGDVVAAKCRCLSMITPRFLADLLTVLMCCMKSLTGKTRTSVWTRNKVTVHTCAQLAVD